MATKLTPTQRLAAQHARAVNSGELRRVGTSGVWRPGNFSVNTVNALVAAGVARVTETQQTDKGAIAVAVLVDADFPL